jgi:hypothetical protein
VLATATAQLFQQGVADPRTLAYREIELTLGDPWSGGGETGKTHGWVLPDGSHAIAWNGLVYNVKSTGPAADLRADMKKLFDEDAAALATLQKENPGYTPHRSASASEAFLTSTSSITAIKVALLCRLGEDALAARVWKAVINDPRQTLEQLGQEDWLWSLYDRGINAHMRGDDALAVESWRALPARASQARFLDGISELLAEAERQVTEPTPRPDQAWLSSLAPLSKEKRIVALIVALEQVSARQWGQPGGVSLGADPIVQALIQEGEGAVEPLLGAFENDTRITRSVQFGRDFARSRSVIAVYEAAYVALVGILDASFFEAMSTGDHLTAQGVTARRTVGKSVREHWARWKGVPAEERFYQTLADDNATPEAWLTAAAQITQPSNVQVVPSSGAFQTSWSTVLPPGQKPTLRGEVLRAKTSPSVSALFEKRVPGVVDVRLACGLARAFAAWDDKASLPRLAAFSRATIAGFAASTDKRYAGVCISSLVSSRAGAGDASALADYGAWIVQTTPEDGEYELEAWFAPMSAHPSDPAVVAAASTLFSAPSPWVPFVSAKASYTKERILERDLWKVNAFKKHVLVELANKTKIGTVKVISDSNVSVKTEGFSSSQGIGPEDPHMPKVGTITDLRVCDEYASAITRGSDFKGPVFRLYWPTAQKDRALAQLITWLKTR